MRNDEQRIEMVLSLLARNARVLLSHDIHTKHRMRSFGGGTMLHVIHPIQGMGMGISFRTLFLVCFNEVFQRNRSQRCCVVCPLICCV